MIRAIIIAVLMVLFGSTAAQAAGTCTPSSSGIAFGTFSGSQVTTTGSITLTCSGTGNFNYTLTLNTGSSGAYSSRTMRNGTNILSYNLFRDAAFTQIWGNGTGGSFTVTGQVSMQGLPTRTINVPVYARLPAQARPPDGTYTDSIIATVTIGGFTATTSFAVTALVQSDCAISATNLAFGAYSGTQLDSQSLISLNCTNSVNWNVGLNQGTFPGATVTTRRMTGPGGTAMNYGLFRNSARTLNWGNTVGTDTISGTGTGGPQSVTVFGRVPAGQILPPGGYLDTIVATITF